MCLQRIWKWKKLSYTNIIVNDTVLARDYGCGGCGFLIFPLLPGFRSRNSAANPVPSLLAFGLLLCLGGDSELFVLLNVKLKNIKENIEKMLFGTRNVED